VDAMTMSGTRLFVSGSSFDSLGIERGSGVPVRELDLAQPAAPALIGEAKDLAGPVSGAATDGSLAFLSDPPFFRVIDVSTTAAPKEIASVQLDDIEPYVKSQGSRVILYGNGKARVIAVISAGATRVNIIYFPAIQLAMAGDLLLIRDPTTLHVFSTADPFAPAEVGAMPLERGGLMAAESGAAWLAMNGTVTRVDVSD